MPLGLLAIGSALADENVVIVDGRFELAPEARVAELAEHAACLAVSVRTGPPLRDALRVSAAARAVNPRLTIVWGGPHATLSPQSCLATEPVDACVRGFGDEAFAAVLGAIQLRARPRRHRRRGRVGRRCAARRAAVGPRRTAAARAYSLLDVERHFEARGARRLDYCSSRGARGGAALDGLSRRARDRRARRAGGPARPRPRSCSRTRTSSPTPRARRRSSSGSPRAARRVGWRATLRIDDVLDGGHDRLRCSRASGCRGVHVPVPPGVPARGGLREQVLDAAALLHAAGIAARFEIELVEPGPEVARRSRPPSRSRAPLCALDGRFETPLRRDARLSRAAGRRARASRPGWRGPTRRGRTRAPSGGWRAPRSSSAEAQRPPGRRPGSTCCACCRCCACGSGFFGLDFERLAVEASAVLRTGRARAPRRRVTVA